MKLRVINVSDELVVAAGDAGRLQARDPEFAKRVEIGTVLEVSLSIVDEKPSKASKAEETDREAPSRSEKPKAR